MGAQVTAINLIIQEKARKGFILADCAYTDQDGRVVEIGSKIVQGGGRFPWAFGVSGNVHTVTVGKELLSVGVASLKQLQKRLGPAMRRAIAATVQRYPDIADPTCSVRGAAWCFASKRPIGFLMMSHPQTVINDPTLEPFVWYELEWQITNGDHPDIGAIIDTDLTNPDLFDVRSSARALISAQRRTAMTPSDSWCGDTPQHRIGGNADLVTVSKHGVIIEEVCSWPDAIGEMIRPHG